MVVGSIETTLELWASSLRELKARIASIISSEAGGGVGWSVSGWSAWGTNRARRVGCVRKRPGILARGVSRRSWAAVGGTRMPCAISYAITCWKPLAMRMGFSSLMRRAF